MRLKRIVLGLMALAGVAFAIVPGAVSARQSHSSSESGSSVPRYQHIVEIMMENTSYGTIIGNSLAPNINALANRYGLATNYFGVTHPSEPNYVANIGGSYFGIQDDNQFYCTPALAATDPNCAGTTVNHTVSAKSLADQLTAAGKTWKGYFQNLPYVDPSKVVSSGPGANGPYAFKWPSNTQRPVCLEAQPVHQLRRDSGGPVSDGSRQPAGPRSADGPPAELQPGGPGPVPRHARHGRLL